MLIYVRETNIGKRPEKISPGLCSEKCQAILLGLIIILGASVLVLLLFVMAAGFNALGLNNPDESLGLPKGTVRAMIALLLIIVWVIVSIYLFIVIPNTAHATSGQWHRTLQIPPAEAPGRRHAVDHGDRALVARSQPFPTGPLRW